MVTPDGVFSFSFAKSLLFLFWDFSIAGIPTSYSKMESNRNTNFLIGLWYFYLLYKFTFYFFFNCRIFLQICFSLRNFKIFKEYDNLCNFSQNIYLFLDIIWFDNLSLRNMFWILFLLNESLYFRFNKFFNCIWINDKSRVDCLHFV